MTITKEQQAAMLEAAKPLMKWLADNCHPHCGVNATATDIELVEGIATGRTFEFITLRTRP